MAYSRPRDLPVRPDDVTLTRRMAGIGMNWATEADTDAQIEETLVFASELGVEDNDFRVLAVLTTWLDVHHDRINADRLTRLVRWTPVEACTCVLDGHRVLAASRSTFGQAPKASMSSHRSTCSQWVRNSKLHAAARMRGFAGSVLRVPADMLRCRPADVVSPEALVRMHRGYRNRVLMGPTWRADVWVRIGGRTGDHRGRSRSSQRAGARSPRPGRSSRTFASYDTPSNRANFARGIAGYLGLDDQTQSSAMRRE